MASEANLVREPGLKSENDLSALVNQFKGVEISGDNQIDVADGGGEHIIGVLYNRPAVGEAAEVVVGGTAKAKAGAAITAGAKIMVAADGDFVAWVTGNESVGIAKTGAGADQEIFSLMLGQALGRDA